MEKETLHRFFAGKASIQEGMSIKTWMEASEENKRTFLKERRLFDALILHDERKQTISTRKIAFHGWMKEIMKVAAVMVLTLSTYSLYLYTQHANEIIALNTVTVPAGQRTHLTLPDGSQIWLNARTTLQYPANFNQKERKVVLEGEAYFDVAKNTEKPFIVQTEKYQVEVLGTQFDVEAYPGQANFETTLMQGSVKVSSKHYPEQSLLLKPHQKAYVKNGQLATTTVNDYSSYRWKEGLMCFKDTPFLNIMEEFEKYYGIQIKIENKEVLSFSYNGKFRQSDGIDYALNVLQRDIHFKYTKDIENQIIYIQ